MLVSMRSMFPSRTEALLLRSTDSSLSSACRPASAWNRSKMDGSNPWWYDLEPMKKSRLGLVLLMAVILPFKGAMAAAGCFAIRERSADGFCPSFASSRRGRARTDGRDHHGDGAAHASEPGRMTAPDSASLPARFVRPSARLRPFRPRRFTLSRLPTQRRRALSASRETPYERRRRRARTSPPNDLIPADGPPRTGSRSPEYRRGLEFPTDRSVGDLGVCHDLLLSKAVIGRRSTVRCGSVRPAVTFPPRIPLCIRGLSQFPGARGSLLARCQRRGAHARWARRAYEANAAGSHVGSATNRKRIIRSPATPDKVKPTPRAAMGAWQMSRSHRSSGRAAGQTLLAVVLAIAGPVRLRDAHR